MTRLTEALERAQAASAETPAVVDAPQPARDVPADWQFNEAARPIDERFSEVNQPVDESATVDALFPQRLRAEPVAFTTVVKDPVAKDSRGAMTAAVEGTPLSPRLTTVATAEPLTQKLVIGQHDNVLIEQFRRLAAVLHHAQMQRQARSVMIASAVPAEGKSLTATNLALTLSQSFEKRVLLIDADLRRPSLHTVLGVPNTAGLTTGLTDPSQPKLPVVPVQQNLWLLPAGRPDPNPTSLLTSPAMRELLAEATSQFDWVIIDTPPVGLMPDANLLAAMVDAAFVVVHAGRTPFPLVQKAVAAIGLERVLGVVLNQAERAAAAGAYSYSYYDYYTDESRGGANRKRFALG